MIIYKTAPPSSTSAPAPAPAPAKSNAMNYVVVLLVVALLVIGRRHPGGLGLGADLFGRFLEQGLGLLPGQRRIGRQHKGSYRRDMGTRHTCTATGRISTPAIGANNTYPRGVDLHGTTQAYLVAKTCDPMRRLVGPDR